MVAEHPVWQGWVTLSLLVLMLIALMLEVAPPHLVMMLTVTIFIPLKIIDLHHAVQGFSDDAVLSIAVLYVVAKGFEQSGGLEYIAKLLFKKKGYEEQNGEGKKKNSSNMVWVLLQLLVPLAIVSAFIVNIPLVALMIPLILKFHRKIGMPPPQLLMPLSFSVQLGGTATLIGDSTNLLVVSLASKKIPGMRMHLFEIGVIGVPLIICGILYMITLSGKLLPSHFFMPYNSDDARKYNMVLEVTPISRLSNKSIKKSHLYFPGLQLVQIDRDGTVISSFGSNFVLHPGDQLFFSGVIDSILFLMQKDGLALIDGQGKESIYLNKLTVNQRLFEAVVANGSPMVHQNVSGLQLTNRNYRAVIVAIHRHGSCLNTAISNIELEAGDCLLVIADDPLFVSKNRNNSTFSLVCQLPGFVPIQRHKAIIAATIILGMIIANALGVNLVTAGLVSAAVMLITKCLTPQDAMDSLDLTVIIMFAAALGISEAMIQSGAATMAAKALMRMSRNSEVGLITCTFITTNVFSLVITNTAAVTMMFPVALAASRSIALDFRPLAYSLIMASASGLMTPPGCASNFMVYAPGGYKFMDYIKYGGPLQIMIFGVTVGIISTLKWWWLWWIALTVLAIVSTPFIAKLPWNQMKGHEIQERDCNDKELGVTGIGTASTSDTVE